MKEILITSSVLIAALLLLRLIFAKKVSRTLIYGAWILVALRLLIPVQIGQLRFSVLTAAQDVTQTMQQVATRPVSGPSKQEVYQDIVVDYVEKDQTVFVPQVQEQIREELSQGTTNPAEIVDKIQQKYPQQEIFVPQVEQQVQLQVEQTKTAPTLGQIAKVVWLVGVAGMTLWFLAVNLRHSLQLRREREQLDLDSPIPVYASEKASSPCLVGLFRPTVYVTPRCAENPQMLRHVLKHELTHYHHGDHIWSLVRCICLCVYWFNPLVWAAAYISRRDCELACDEGAMKGLGEAERLAYGKTLLEVVSHAANPGNLLQTATSMNETMKQLKERVNFIVKKPKFSITAAICMVLVCALIAGCVAAGPTSTQSDPPATTTTTPPTTTQSKQDVTAVKTLASNMYCTTILAEDQSEAGQFEAALDLTVTEHTDSSVSLECALALADDVWYDFTDSGNSFTVQHEELGLPYYCAKAHIYQPVSDGYAPYDFAVDVEKGYLIFKLSANVTTSYVVASSDPKVDPMEIVEHFAQFFKIYDGTFMDTGIKTDFYFDLYGAWISENGEILGEMPFYVTGKLPEVYEDGDTVEMELNFIWPETFGYRNEGTMTYTGTVNIFENHHGHPNFHGTGTLYDLDTNEPISFAYNIFPLDMTVIIYVNGQYLINYLRTPSQIESRLSYYKEFIFTVPKPSEPTELLSMIPEETQKRIKEEYLTQFYAQYPEDPGAIDRTSLRVFGVFGDTYALFVDGPFAYLQVISKGTFGLTYPTSQNMYVYRDGRFYCGLEAEGLLTGEEKRQVVTNYYATYPFLQEEPEDQPANEELAAFNALFGDRQSWYNKALTFEYTDPSKMQLRLLFYLGFEGESREPTVAEWAQLRNQPGFDIHYGLIRLPVDKMNQVLADLFGITLENVDDSGFENLVYLESTNCYYHMVTDALRLEDFNALSVENKEDGSIRVYYTANWEDTVYVVTLMPHGDGYKILSNVRAE